MWSRVRVAAGALWSWWRWPALAPLAGLGCGAGCSAALIADHRWEPVVVPAGVGALIGGIALIWTLARSVAPPLSYAGLFLLALWLLTPSERIVFASDRDTPGRPQIYALDVGGGDPDRLSATPGQDDGPAVSPDGDRIAFTRRLDGRERLFIAGRHGEDAVAMPAEEGDDHHPSWSPDGRWIAFASDRGGNWDIYIVAPDGSRLRAIGAGPARDDWPAWSPDGRTLAFESDRGGAPNLWLASTDGTGVRPLRDDGTTRRQPAWSPDGRLAFVAGDGSDAVCVAVVGEGTDRCLAVRGYYAAPAWSPSGRRLAYAARGTDGWAILVVPDSGGQPRDVSRYPGLNITPSWTSNGPIPALTRWWVRLVA